MGDMEAKSKESEPQVQSEPVPPPAATSTPPGEPPLSETERVPRDRAATGKPALRLSRIWLARILAMAADATQWALLPLVMGGVISPVADAIDIAMAILMTWLLGWHWAFLPTFLAELVPFVDLVPSWTLAAFIATRGKDKPAPRRPA